MPRLAQPPAPPRGPSAPGEPRCRQRATSSFPEPVLAANQRGTKVRSNSPYLRPQSPRCHAVAQQHWATRRLMILWFVNRLPQPLCRDKDVACHNLPRSSAQSRFRMSQPVYGKIGTRNQTNPTPRPCYRPRMWGRFGTLLLECLRRGRRAVGVERPGQFLGDRRRGRRLNRGALHQVHQLPVAQNRNRRRGWRMSRQSSCGPSPSPPGPAPRRR